MGGFLHWLMLRSNHPTHASMDAWCLVLVMWCWGHGRWTMMTMMMMMLDIYETMITQNLSIFIALTPSHDTVSEGTDIYKIQVHKELCTHANIRDIPSLWLLGCKELSVTFSGGSKSAGVHAVYPPIFPIRYHWDCIYRVLTGYLPCADRVFTVCWHGKYRK